MSDPTDEKIELLVRSVLAAVDARLVEVRNEIQAVATDVSKRHREVLSQIRELEMRWEARVTEPGPSSLREASPILADLSVTPPSLDPMSAPFRVGPHTGSVPVAATLPSSITLPPIPPLTSAPPRESSDGPAEPIDMSRLADLLSERLGSLNLPTQQQN